MPPVRTVFTGRIGMLATALLLFALAPLWSVAHFMTQDGPSHLYSADVMRALLQGDSEAAARYTFNAWAMPNSTGHWLIVLLSHVASPFVVTKILVTLTYAGFVIAIGWLRLRTVGRDGLATSLLFAAAVGFNWLWLAGLYNFGLGLIGFVVAIGLCHSWRHGLTPLRIAALALLTLFVYFSHLVSFGMLIGALFVFAVTSEGGARGRTVAAITLAIAPAAIVAMVYATSAPAAEPWVPHWNWLHDASSTRAWFDQLRSVDPFILISRRALPFVAAESGAFVVMAPSVWLLCAGVGLAVATVVTRGGRPVVPRALLPFAVMCGIAVLIAIVGPDDLGRSHGAVLRERLLLCGAGCVVPLFTTQASRAIARGVHACLVIVIVFQTATLWDYARNKDTSAVEFMAARNALGEDDAAAAVVILEGGHRFSSNPESQMNALNGIGRRGPVWDDYELGYSLFPVIARHDVDRSFIFDWTRASTIDLGLPSDRLAAAVTDLAAQLETSHDRIARLLVWGSDARVEAAIDRWFDSSPAFAGGRVRVFRHR